MLDKQFSVPDDLALGNAERCSEVMLLPNGDRVDDVSCMRVGGHPKWHFFDNGTIQARWDEIVPFQKDEP